MRYLTIWTIGMLVLATNGFAEEIKKDQQRIEDLEKKVSDLEKRLEETGTSESPDKNEDSKNLFGLVYRSQEALRFGTYGESKVRYQDSPAGSEVGFDNHRLVLLGGYQPTDWMAFNMEIEFEHGGSASSVDGDDKTFEGGNIEVEQAYIDFFINEHFNWRSIGIDLVPVGYINLHHEPTNFYSTERPEIYKELIPSTWFEGSTSIFGKIVDGLDYQVQVSTGLEDNASPQSDGVPTGAINGKSGIRKARPAVGDFNQSNNDFGYAVRLSYQPAFIPGLAGSSSGYFTRSTPRNPFTGPFVVSGDSEVAIFDTELRYRLPKTGLELRGEYVHILLGNNQNLLANSDGDPTNNTGDQMFGGYFEGAYHIDFRQFTSHAFDLVPFYRISYIDLQSGSYQGLDANVPTGQGDRLIHTFGAAFFVTPQVVLKLDYAIPMDESLFGPEANRLQGAIGWFF